ncbi:uncharacterized protein LOC132560160 [Ylistrum balloti]|uniref:uncharacterized protein LOC132560160 n=1 Tax=Ylistrum balloti TaxID=509963 RepID=UPI002905E681|nr:uncharacterized protein LOC132560160 [Ylistrum balloti]
MGDKRVQLIMDYAHDRTLSIKNIKVSDAGSYECLADSNTVPLAIYNVTVLANEEPQTMTTQTQKNAMTTTQMVISSEEISTEVITTSTLTSRRKGGNSTSVEEKLADPSGKGGRLRHNLVVLLTVMYFGIFWLL